MQSMQSYLGHVASILFLTDTIVFIIDIEVAINVLYTLGVWKSWTVKPPNSPSSL